MSFGNIGKSVKKIKTKVENKIKDIKVEFDQTVIRPFNYGYKEPSERAEKCYNRLDGSNLTPLYKKLSNSIWEEVSKGDLKSLSGVENFGVPSTETVEKELHDCTQQFNEVLSLYNKEQKQTILETLDPAAPLEPKIKEFHEIVLIPQQRTIFLATNVKEKITFNDNSIACNREKLKTTEVYYIIHNLGSEDVIELDVKNELLKLNPTNYQIKEIKDFTTNPLPIIYREISRNSHDYLALPGAEREKISGCIEGIFEKDEEL